MYCPACRPRTRFTRSQRSPDDQARNFYDVLMSQQCVGHRAVIGGGALLLVDLMFLAANMTKLVHGAWLPLLIAVIAFTVMTTWQRGREIITRAREQAEGPLREFVDELADCRQPLPRIPAFP